MRISGFMVKAGLAAAFILCVVLFLLRDYIPPVVAMARMQLNREPRYYSLWPALTSYAHQQGKKTKTKRIRDGIKLIQTDALGFEQYSTGSRDYWIPRSDLPGLASQLIDEKSGLYDVGARVHPGDVVLDCGANKGTFAAHALRLGAAKVVAIEPAPLDVECLNRNFKAEVTSGKVVVYPKGVWNKDDYLEMDLDPKTTGLNSFVLQRKGANRIRLPLTTIDRITEELKLSKVDFIKMDIEGSERHALAGAVNTLRRFHPRMAICVYHLPDDPVIIPQLIRSAWPGYQVNCGSCLYRRGRIVPEIYFFF